MMKYILAFVLLFSLSGCTQLKNFHNTLVNIPTKQVAPTKQVTAKKQVVAPKPIKKSVSNQCGYVIRDLSQPNSSAVWCMPKEAY